MGRKKKRIVISVLFLFWTVCLAGCRESSEQNLQQAEGEVLESGNQAAEIQDDEGAKDEVGNGLEAEDGMPEEAVQKEAGENGNSPEPGDDASKETTQEAEDEMEGETLPERRDASGRELAMEPEDDLEEKVSPERNETAKEIVFASEDWGLSFGEPGTQPAGNAAAADLAWYNAYFVGEDSEKVIYLTFDCGYENGNTEPILDALKKHGVTATFFVVGHFLETAPDMVKRMAEEGHMVGNHTYHHPDMSAISDKSVFQKEMDDVAELFYAITGKELSHYYRPPQGKCNAENLRMAKELGYSTIFWSLAYVDWDTDKQPSHEEAFDKLTTRIHPGAIVLLHNTSQTNGEILDELLTKWEKMGYRFGLLPELEEPANRSN